MINSEDMVMYVDVSMYMVFVLQTGSNYFVNLFRVAQDQPLDIIKYYFPL